MAKDGAKTSLFISGLTLLIWSAISPSVYAGDVRKGIPNYFLTSSFSFPHDPQIDHLTVAADEQLEGDVVVYSGDVSVQAGGQILGNLIVASGDINVETGGQIHGDVTSLSGDVTIAGKILGDLAVASGSVTLMEKGSVDGDVSVWSGTVRESPRSTIHGELRVGLNVRDIPSLADVMSSSSQAPKNEPRRAASGGYSSMLLKDYSLVGHLAGSTMRLVSAGFLLIFASAVSGALEVRRPHYVETVRRRLRSDLHINLAAGILFNLVMGVLVVLFFATCLLIPVALLALGLLIAINGIGWTAVAGAAGRRLTRYTGRPVQSATTAVLGSVVLAIPLAGSWAIGGGLAVLGFLTGFGLISTGAGTVLLPWLRRLSGDENAFVTS